MQIHRTLFALDCGATNWRLYRAGYQVIDGAVRLIEEPKPSPLTSFIDRKLPAAILLSPQGDTLEAYGEVAQQALEDEETRERVRDYFKPCIGNHLGKSPLPHQKRYTHSEALHYTQMLLLAVVAQICSEKWRATEFDERVGFAFAFPVYWSSVDEGSLFEAFATTVYECFPERIHSQIRFVTEPEAAILSLRQQGLLTYKADEGATLVIDIGGSTTDIVACEMDPAHGEVNYIGCYGEPLGGGLYDAELAKHIADELNIPASALADDPSAMISLRIFGRRLKEVLSRQILHSNKMDFAPRRTITLVMKDGKVYRKVIGLDEARFSEMTDHLHHRFEMLINEALSAIDLVDREIGQVVLVGGGSQLFTLVHHLRERFGMETVVLADNPDELVVHGVGLEYGASYMTSHPSMILVPGLQGSEVPEGDGSIGDRAARGEDEDGLALDLAWCMISEGIRMPLNVEGVTRIGRALLNDLHLRSDKISRHHAELSYHHDRWNITDLGSTNGTFVNGEHLTANQSYPLKEGDIVRFGDKSFTLRT
jgi:hypothetical protein